MRKTRYQSSQIRAILQQAKSGVPITTLLREYGISSATFYVWRAKHGGADESLILRIKELDDENSRLKKMYAEAKIKTDIIREALNRKCNACQIWRHG